MVGKGKFIVIEGLDGSGKDTQIKKLYSMLENDGVSVVLTAEPTNFETGKLLRRALSGEIYASQAELAALFLADRICHNNAENVGIIDLLENGSTVICGRYYYSSFAYQGIDTDLSWVMDMNLCCKDITKPDLCIFLDVSPEICEKRIAKGRNSLEIFEKLETQKRVRQRFYDVFELIKERENICIVNADGEIDEITKELYTIVKAL